MFKKTIKVFILFGVILFGLAGNIGCSPSDDNQNSVMATYIETYFQEDIAEGEYNIVDNRLDLVAPLNSDLSEKYNDAFFKNHSLLVFAIAESSHGNKSEIESYAIRDKTLTVQVKTTRFGDDCMMGYWWFILELSKDEIDHFNRVKIVKNGEEIMNNDKQIILDFIKYAHSIGIEYVNTDNVEILENYGKYSEAIIVKMSRKSFEVITYVSFQELGINMRFADSNIPLVYKDRNFYELKDAYIKGIITKENLAELQDKIESKNDLNSDNRENKVNSFYVKLDYAENDLTILNTRKNLTDYFLLNAVKEDKLDKYNDDFFISKSLIVFTNFEESSENESIITSYTIQDDRIIINVDTIKDSDNGMMSYGYFILEFNKEKLKDIKKINVVKNGKPFSAEDC